MTTQANLPFDLQHGEIKPKNVQGGGAKQALKDIGNLVDVSKCITRQEVEKNKGISQFQYSSKLTMTFVFKFWDIFESLVKFHQGRGSRIHQDYLRLLFFNL